MIISFKEWLHFAETQTVAQVFLQENPKNPQKSFVVVVGNTFPIKNQLMELGFKYFKGSWSIPKDIFDQPFMGSKHKKLDQPNEPQPLVKDLVRDLGIDLSGLNLPIIKAKKQDAQTQPVTPLHVTSADNMLNQMNQILDTAENAETDAQAKKMFQSLEMQIEKLANSTDEAAKQEFIQAFLRFSSRFHNYSFRNQLLIWAQTRGKATEVASQKKWLEMGRTVVDWSRPIRIWAPITPKKTATTDDDVTKDQEEQKKEFVPFKLVKVYDVDATQEIPGHKNVYRPLKRKDWSVDTNEDIEELNLLINSALAYIRNSQIDFDYEKLEDEIGGYSAGGKIRVNTNFKGINVFSTIIHELAHEILHQDKKKSNDTSRKEKEIEAESTAFIVLNHFGFETKDAPNYLALWKAKGEDIKARRNQINYASKTIIDGIKNNIENVELHLDDE